MKITTRPATRSDVLKVIVNLSRESTADVRRIGKTPEEVMGFFAMRLPEKDAVTFVNGAAPMAVFGWDKWSPDGAWYSWFLAAQSFFPGNPKPVIAARRHLRDVQVRNPGVRLLSANTMDTVEVRRWMRLLGFKRLYVSPLTLWQFEG